MFYPPEAQFSEIQTLQSEWNARAHCKPFLQVVCCRLKCSISHQMKAPDPNPAESNSHRRVVSISSFGFSMLLTNYHRVELLHDVRPNFGESLESRNVVSFLCPNTPCCSVFSVIHNFGGKKSCQTPTLGELTSRGA